MTGTADPTSPSGHAHRLSLGDLRMCFEGVVPAVIATSAADGTPNITYLSRVRMVDDERVALSNQFFSKTSRNLTENPRACLLLIDPVDYSQYQLTLEYERTERRGPVFERLRDDVDLIASLQGMQDVFRLRAADIYRVVDIEFLPSALNPEPPNAARDVGAGDSPPGRRAAPRARGAGALVQLSAGDRLERLAELSGRLARCTDLDSMLDAALTALDALFGYEHSVLLIHDEQSGRLVTIASHGYSTEGVGSEVPLGEGIIGIAAQRCRAVRVGNLRQMAKYSRSVRRSFEDSGVAPGREIPVPGILDAESRIAVPAAAFGCLVAVLSVESTRPAAFDEHDEDALRIVASMVAHAIEAAREDAEPAVVDTDRPSSAAEPTTTPTEGPLVRFFTVDGSTFIDGDYLIKGVAGRILWSLLRHHQREGRVEFTNREVRLDPTLELPAFRDNLESRLILLKRRLDEREAPVRITSTGRGKFRLEVERPVRLESTTPG